MRRLLLPLFILALVLGLTNCADDRTYKDDSPPETVTSIVYRDATTTTTAVPTVFSPEDITWEEFCSPEDGFCASFPEVPGDERGFETSTITPEGETRSFNAYSSDLGRGFAGNKVVFCNDILAVECKQDDTSRGVNADMYGVYVGSDEDPSLNFDDYDQLYGDCGGRTDRQVSPLTINGYVGAKITCRYSYSEESYRTLYFFRLDGKVIEVNASNQTTRPYFEEKFLSLFRPTG